MQNNKVHAGIDGSLLLEEVAAHVLKNYLGSARARSFVFGTATPGNFSEKVNALCRELGEGDGFSSLDNAPVMANDDKLDAVAWIPFADRLPGQLILFGQCKTGTSWYDSTTQLQPDVFIKKWTMARTFVVSPVRAFCVAEAADRSHWRGTCLEAGMLFDRCRLVDFCNDLPSDLERRIVQWTDAAKTALSCFDSV